MLAYINATLFEGMTKKEAYLTHINSTLSHPHQAVLALEKKPEFRELYDHIMEDDNARLQAKANKIKLKYASLIEKNIDTASAILDEVEDGELQDKAVAVRLVNETVGAMAIVSGTSQPTAPGKLDKSGVVS